MTVETSDQGAVRLITMNRPEALNAFGNQLMDDLAEMGQPTRVRPKHGFPGLLDALIDFPKPFLIAVNGVGAGIGATICGLGDVCFMAEGARLRCRLHPSPPPSG